MTGSLSRSMRIALVVSLALNLFVVGAVATDMIFGPGWIANVLDLRNRPSRLTGMPNPRELRQVLSDDGRAILKEILESRRPLFRENLTALFDARQGVADTIQADPFDKARLEAAFGVLREREAAMATIAQGTILELIGRLDAPESDRVAELLRTRHKRPE